MSQGVYSRIFELIIGDEGDCYDTNNVATDHWNKGCTWYNNLNMGDLILCGVHDDKDFAAFEMCCACKGNTQLLRLQDHVKYFSKVIIDSDKSI